MIGALVRKIKTFGGQSTFTKLWFIPTWFLLGLAKVAIFCVTFRRLAPFLGRPVGVDAWVPLATGVMQERALQIGRTVKLAAGYTPWVSNCFPQAVAARVLLGVYGIPYAIYFGVLRDKSTKDMQAHAWVSCGRVSVTGGAGHVRYTVVGMFVSPRHLAEPKA